MGWKPLPRFESRIDSTFSAEASDKSSGEEFVCNFSRGLVMRFFLGLMMSLALGGTTALILTGCSGRPSLLPNPDPQLRHSSAEFAADAAKRFPYKTDLTSAQTTARAQVGYMLNVLEIGRA